MIVLGYRLSLKALPECLEYLTLDEKQYVQSVSSKRALSFANGRVLIKQLLSKYFLIDISDIQIDLPNHQAPNLVVKGQNWFLSISHSGQAVCVAISPSLKIGVDIEQTKDRDFLAFKNDYEALSDVTDLNSFYQRWSFAEAYSKLSGLPLLQVLKNKCNDELLYSFLPLNGYMLCLVYQQALAEITIDRGI